MFLKSFSYHTVVFMRRLAASYYLGFHFITGFIFSVLFIWIFGEITESILSGDALILVDQWVVRHVLFFRTTLVTSMMEALTNLGGIKIIGPCSLLIMSYLILRRDHDTATGLAAAVLGGILLNNFLKILIHRPRPLSDKTLITVYGWSFPSGHAMNSIIFYGVITYLLVRGIRSWSSKAVIITIALCIIFIIGFSRIYLQVHYLSDVIAGYAGGLFWLSVCITGMEMMRKNERIDNVPDERRSESS
jgi:membrane-associated phospholipid phosphatase